HSFMDVTKELCSDNRHRILHTLWGIRRIILPLFGHTLINADGKKINVKDLCEKDHILPDFQNRFIPTLGDFCAAMEDDLLPANYGATIDQLHAQYAHQPELSELLLSPLAATGQLKSLLITHNSWFLNELVPKLFPGMPQGLRECPLAATDLFASMRFELWMDNGAGWPPSTRGLRAKEAPIRYRD
ncbi:MAG: hypothetical protein AAF840_18815, partial [Bacteroidota bacterium]